jgi:hypothetical protein
MGAMKQLMFEDWAKRDAAVQVALKVGLLRTCRHHDDQLLDPLSCNVEDAYRLGNYLVTKNEELVSVFKGDRRELTDYLQQIANDFGTECPICTSR